MRKHWISYLLHFPCRRLSRLLKKQIDQTCTKFQLRIFFRKGLPPNLQQLSWLMVKIRFIQNWFNIIGFLRERYNQLMKMNSAQSLSTNLLIFRNSASKLSVWLAFNQKAQILIFYIDSSTTQKAFLITTQFGQGTKLNLNRNYPLGCQNVIIKVHYIIFILNKQSQLKMASNSDYNIFSIKYIAASFAATYFSGVVHPLELIKTRFQSHDGKSASQNLVPKYTNIRNALKVIYANQGLRGLYKGFYISLLCQASSMSFFFWNYQTRKKEYLEGGLETMDAVTRASIEASILTTFLTQPIWVIKTRMLLNVNKNISEFQNLKNQSLEIYNQHGFTGFLKGLQLSIILSFSGVVQMYVYQGAKILYDQLNIPESGLSEKHFLCGALSKVFSVMLSYPITTLRTRIQQNQFVGQGGSQKYNGIVELMFRTLREEGVRGFYKGISANLMRGISQKGIYFYFYEMFKDVLFPKTSSTTEKL